MVTFGIGALLLFGMIFVAETVKARRYNFFFCRTLVMGLVGTIREFVLVPQRIAHAVLFPSRPQYQRNDWLVADWRLWFIKKSR